jgi:hypothetical protein
MGNIGFYHDGENEHECTIIKRGTNNVRIQLANAPASIKVPRESVREWRLDQPCRIVPNLPIARLYKYFRDLTGSPNEKLSAIKSHLGLDRYGSKHDTYLSEIFARSLSQSNFYDNRYSPFHPAERGTPKADSPFADSLVANWIATRVVEFRGSEICYVDRELAPFGTHKSCTELGESAEYSSGGGMDLLLASGAGSDCVIPVVCEIKASTETVGPTFALTQSIMYAAQLATKNQFCRLRRTYPSIFSKLQVDSPQCKVLIIIETPKGCEEQDLHYANELANSTLKALSERGINEVQAIEIAGCQLVTNEINLDLFFDSEC